MKRDKFKFLKLLNEYRSLNYELKYVKEVLGRRSYWSLRFIIELGVLRTILI